jgi:hypothetical protein
MAHSYVMLVLYIVFSTKGRAPFIGAEHRDRLYAYMGGIILFGRSGGRGAVPASECTLCSSASIESNSTSKTSSIEPKPVSRPAGTRAASPGFQSWVWG